MNNAAVQSYLTTIFGILAGLPTLVLAYFTPGSVMALSSSWTRWLMIIGGVGVIGLGLVAKAFNVHSTIAQVEAATATVVNDPKAPAMVAEADAQVASKK